MACRFRVPLSRFPVAAFVAFVFCLVLLVGPPILPAAPVRFPVDVSSPSLVVADGSSRKLLTAGETGNLIAVGKCTNRDISITQSRDASTIGIPRFIVQVVNTCVSGCTPSNIHISCGWFASTLMINPAIFHRVDYNDCLVNAGRPLGREAILRFTYQNSFMYHLTFKSATLC